jgi:hypothetical protein
MAGLSPEAQAVLDAFTGNDTIHGLHLMLPQLAAALRAATDQVVPELQEPDWGACVNTHCDIELYTDHQRKRTQLLAIVTELDAQ